MATPLAIGTMAALVDKREIRIRSMFNHIAPSYDFLNHLLSLNIDHYWRWRTTRLVPPRGPAPILDLCTGTGDLALAYDRAAEGKVPIVGADFCHEMLRRAAFKTDSATRPGASVFWRPTPSICRFRTVISRSAPWHLAYVTSPTRIEALPRWSG